MLRQSVEAGEAPAANPCAKVRKRGALSSSGTSSSWHAVARRGSAPHRAVSEMSKRSSRRSRNLEEDEKRSCGSGHGRWLLDVRSNGGATEGPKCSRDLILMTSSGEKPMRLNDLHNSLIASKELVKLLPHIWGPGELHPSTISLLSALRSELDIGRLHARRLIEEHQSVGDELEGLKKQLLDEMEEWKHSEKEKVETTLQLVVGELENERKSRRRAERMNKKLGAALAAKEASLQAATRELERERRSRERVEKICSELIRGIGEDKAEVEELRRETEEAQEELEKEREMLRLADELREERVQMKLLEARFQFEERNAAIDQLRHELEAFLETKKEQEPTDEPYADAITANVTADDKGGGAGDGDGEVDSEGSDVMHSIELNMDSNSKSYSRSLETRRTASRHGSFSDRGVDGGGGSDLWGPDPRFQEPDEELGVNWDEGYSDGARNFDQDVERYQAIKNLREQMLAGSGFILSQSRD